MTGLPFADQLLEAKELSPDQWRDNSGRKRIIYAPHHTIGDIHMKGCDYGTFLETGNIVLELAKSIRIKFILPLNRTLFCGKDSHGFGMKRV